MTNPFDYLWYKLTIFLTPFVYGSPAYRALPIMTAVFAFNGWTVLNIAIRDYNSYLLSLVFLVPLVLTETIYSRKRLRKVYRKYISESDSQRILGNWLVFLYVVATVGLLIWSFRFVPVNN
jgi:hypothetical protein